MKKKLHLLFGLPVLFAIGTVALAKDDIQDPQWLSSDEINTIVAQEPPPPAPGSDADKADLQAEIDAQNGRTPMQIAEAKTDEHYSLSLFEGVTGVKITKDKYPVTSLFLAQVNKEISELVATSKNHWQRPRPYQAHGDVIHSLFPAGGFSYPSGHATAAFGDATVLGELFPDKAPALLERARLIAQSRVDAGVHYESDIKEGEVLGKEIAQDLLAKPAYVAALNAAKAELVAKPGP